MREEAAEREVSAPKHLSRQLDLVAHFSTEGDRRGGFAAIAKENVSVGHGPPRRLLGSLGGLARWSLAIGRPGRRRCLARPDPAVDGDGYQVYGRIGRQSCHRGIA